jgi:hypothetical protein
VTGVPLHIRAAPGTDSISIGSISQREVFTVTGTANAADGTKWLRIIARNQSAQDGWIAERHTKPV